MQFGMLFCKPLKKKIIIHTNKTVIKPFSILQKHCIVSKGWPQDAVNMSFLGLFSPIHLVLYLSNVTEQFLSLGKVSDKTMSLLHFKGTVSPV